MSALVDGTTKVGTRRIRRLRRFGLASAVAGAAALLGGVAYALLTATGTGSGSASLGSVSIGTPVTTACSYTNLAPGDLTGSHTCSLGVTYSGTLPAYMSLTVQVQSAKGIGTKSLYDGSNSTGLTLSISDGHTTYIVPTGTGVTGSPCPATYTCWTATNELAAWYSGSTPNLSFTTGKAVTWTVTPRFPTIAGNPYQGAHATVTLTAQAVQAGANPLPAGCTTSTIGHPCAATATFQWS
ncbi:MAG TPA: hypothetical protein VFC09_03715 [Candidatus Dormibacteraeota bacterium]|nr:hypothetical protein [Candidatus Dormibacteraeota bacterium]